MNIKNAAIVLISIILGGCLFSPSGWAGNVQRNRWEGVAIGIGAAVLGHTLFNNYFHRQPAPEVVYRHPSPRRYKHHHHRRARGHWEIRKKWIPPTYERVWNPGHYNRGGRWIDGQWIEIEREPGYWIEKRVWVSKHSRRHR